MSLINLGEYQRAMDAWNYDVMMIFAENDDFSLEIKLLLAMIEYRLNQNLY